MRRCTKCEVEFPATLEYFHAKKEVKSGLRADCKLCRAAEIRDYTEYIKARNAQYYLNNKEQILKNTSAYKKNNVDIVRRYSRRSGSKRRALEKGNGYLKYTEDQVLEFYGTNCNICRTPIDLFASRRVGWAGWEKGLHIDHLVPISNGGADTLENVRPTHGKCNLDKGIKIYVTTNGR